MPSAVECPVCHGTGLVGASSCGRCRGTGSIKAQPGEEAQEPRAEELASRGEARRVKAPSVKLSGAVRKAGKGLSFKH